MKTAGWTVCTNWGSDRPVYEADLLVCRHCGKTKFMCDSITRKPLPADAVYEKCTWCFERICNRCLESMRKGGKCQHFLDKIGAEEEQFDRILKLGSYL